ncbi:lipid-A-disaccharide synthase [Elusimicrobiota bacterium]
MPTQKLSKHILVTAGEPSSDLLASLVIKDLKKRFPDIRVSALGGKNLAAIADSFIFDLSNMGIMGWTDPLLKAFPLLKAYRAVKRKIAADPIDLHMPVDYYGFNVRIASLAKKSGAKVVYYISPQVWATRKNRIHKIRKLTDLVLCLFPFEEPFYNEHGIKACFVGHPMAQMLRKYVNLKSQISNLKSPLVGILPGSRPREIVQNVPILLGAWRKIKNKIPNASAIIFKVNGIPPQLYPEQGELLKMGISEAFGSDHEKRALLDLALTTSGTATLENLILGVPMLSIYTVKPAWLYHVLKRALHIRYTSMPNILANRKIIDEFVWPHKGPLDNIIDEVSASALKTLQNKDSAEAMRKELLKLSNSLIHENRNPIEYASEQIEKILKT